VSQSEYENCIPDGSVRVVGRCSKPYIPQTIHTQFMKLAGYDTEVEYNRTIDVQLLCQPVPDKESAKMHLYFNRANCEDHCEKLDKVNLDAGKKPQW
uniref:ZP domain-containing protein n=1 Tax=Parascaris equorum TaxID=6256 RepID=A0A914S3I5_PAREQ